MIKDIWLIIFGFLGGILITIIGNWVSNYFQHKQKINYMKIQIKFREKIKIHKKIINIINSTITYYEKMQQEIKWHIERGLLECTEIRGNPI